MASRIAEFGAEPAVSLPEELGRFVAAELAKWTEVARQSSISLDRSVARDSNAVAPFAHSRPER